MQNLTPPQIVAELDKYIIGQTAAKRAVAVAIRNRWRRQQLTGPMAAEVFPKNIIMIGPTGVGKTEIARRLAGLTGAPFVKVEASKYTEVGYHGRDVESMVRDLVENAVSMVRSEQARGIREKAAAAAEERLLDLLLPGQSCGQIDSRGYYVAADESQQRREQVRQLMRQQLASGSLDDREVELTVTSRPSTSIMFANMGLDQLDPDTVNLFERLMPEQSKRRRVTVSEARRLLVEQETDKLLDRDKIAAEAIKRAQDSGIIFLDEIDKIALPGGDGGGGSGGGGRGPDVSRQGVQRDLLPIVEGSSVNTRYGVVQTDHILFIAAGAFHSTAVSDLMPELQGRFPIRVELLPLGKPEFVRILQEPSNSLIRQQQALLAVEGLEVVFEPSAIEAVADLAAQANATLENIGARRLMTIMEKVFEALNFDASQRVAAGERRITITEAYVRQQVADIVKDQDLSRFVL